MRQFWIWHRRISSLPISNFRLPAPTQLNELLQHCSNSEALNPGKQTHQKIIIHGLQGIPFVSTKLVQMYADCGDIQSALKLFGGLSEPNVFAWTAIISFFSRKGDFCKCMYSYKDMKFAGVWPDNYVFPKVLKACAATFCLEVGVQVHKDAIVCGVECNIQVSNALIDMYSKCGAVDSGRWIFYHMACRDLLSYNLIISGYVYNGFLELAVGMLGFMKLDGIEPDIVTWNMVMDAYCRMGQCDEAMKIFCQIEGPNVISWTILISEYSRIGRDHITLEMFRNMIYEGKVSADLDCLSSVIASCQRNGLLIFGREIHAFGLKKESGIPFYSSVGPALLTLYAKCGRSRDAGHVFHFMDRSDVVSWNARILGFAELGMVDSAVGCFRELPSMGIKRDKTTFTTILPLCDLKLGMQIHAYILKDNYCSSIPVSNALIHMYAKCGSIDIAHSLFSRMACRDLVSWNTMIGGFGMHGFGQAALQLLQEMISSGVIPNSLTFTSVLSACSHSGLVNEALENFHCMSADFGFNPEMEHFTCIADLLARAGQLEDAVALIGKMPYEPNKHVWGSVLASSLVQQNLSIGVLASEHLIKLEPENAGHYVTLSNMYAKAGKMDDAIEVRKLMESRGLVKQFGYSCVADGS
ncbi:hypothetical protein M9H77_17239 [Catharanthus roseus]|uniref:Uncharacterized protein n=1 Tax=Catharanthus roseus TaxID=4058 RepID=A0ACC0B422_CATRO|nr:hypothetical protein M9H77_17239 [Catharanthus roseus]